MPKDPFMVKQVANTPVQNLEVARQQAGYAVRGHVYLRAPIEAVRALLLDFDRMSQLHGSIQSSELQHIFPDGRHRVRVQIEFCILFFYFTLKSIQDFIWNKHTIRAVILPEKSDFSHGELQWKLVPGNGGTHLQFKAELIPTLLIPPMIGPGLLKSLLLKQARKIVQNVERLAAPECFQLEKPCSWGD
jgi:carbon monoxide dehydrogenase subunit G